MPTIQSPKSSEEDPPSWIRTRWHGGSESHSPAESQALSFVHQYLHTSALRNCCLRVRAPGPSQRPLLCFRFIALFPRFSEAWNRELGARGMQWSSEQRAPAANSWSSGQCCWCLSVCVAPISQRIYITSAHIKSTAGYSVLFEFNCSFNPTGQRQVGRLVGSGRFGLPLQYQLQLQLPPHPLHF